MVGPRNAQFFVTASVALVVDEDTPQRAPRPRQCGSDRACARRLPRLSPARPSIGTSRSVRHPRPRPVRRDRGRQLRSRRATRPSGSRYRRHAIGVMARRLLERAFEQCRSDERVIASAAPKIEEPRRAASGQLRAEGQWPDLRRRGCVVLREPALCPARSPLPDRNQVRLRAWPMRRLHRAYRRGARLLVSRARGDRGRQPRSRRSRATITPTAA